MSSDEAVTIALSASIDSHRGGWWFRNRTWLPIPLALVLIASTHRTPYSFAMVACGVPLVLIGEVIRMYGVRHIGTVSRTRADRTGPLITSGPYALVRNPLYIGNWFIWMGIALASGVLWMIPISWMVFAFIYGRLIAWEEQLLVVRHPTYPAYRDSVPSWIPRLGSRVDAPRCATTVGWRTVLFSERGTLLALLAMLSIVILRQAL
jgi:protein-S-isoprenylcysteine O-methyltransferase Ste14